MDFSTWGFPAQSRFKPENGQNDGTVQGGDLRGWKPPFPGELFGPTESDSAGEPGLHKTVDQSPSPTADS